MRFQDPCCLNCSAARQRGWLRHRLLADFLWRGGGLAYEFDGGNPARPALKLSVVMMLTSAACQIVLGARSACFGPIPQFAACAASPAVSLIASCHIAIMGWYLFSRPGARHSQDRGLRIHGDVASTNPQFGAVSCFSPLQSCSAISFSRLSAGFGTQILAGLTASVRGSNSC